MPKPKMIPCPYCGHKNPADYIRCDYCSAAPAENTEKKGD